MPLSLTIAGQSHTVGADVVTIGRDLACTVAVPDNRLNSFHAEIREVRGRLIIEAREPSELYLGQGRPVHCAWLRAGDRIKLSKNGPELGISADNPSWRLAVLRRWTALGSRDKLAELIRSHRGSACVLALAVGLLALAAFVDGPEPAVQAGHTGIPDTDISLVAVPIEQPDALPSAASRHETTSGSTSEPCPEDIESPYRTPDVTDSLYVVLLKLPDCEKTYRLGTAFAVGPRKLVSSAAIVSALQTHQSAGAKVFVQNAVAQETWGIVDMSVPAGYLDACRQMEAAREQCDSIQNSSQANSTAGGTGDREQKLAPAEESLLRSFESQAFFDAAMIHVEADLPTYLEIEDASLSSILTATSLTLVGLPFPTDQFEVVANAAASPNELPATIISQQGCGTGESRGLLVQCPGIIAGENWSGSPVINASGRVVGVYSRPSPRTGYENDCGAGSLHYVAAAYGLRALMQ